MHRWSADLDVLCFCRSVRYNSLLFKNSLLACKFVDMPVAAGGGGLDARPMDPVFSRASMTASQVMIVLTAVLMACTVLNTRQRTP